MATTRRSVLQAKRAVIAAMLREQPDQTNWKVAQACGVHVLTANAVRLELEARGEIPRLDQPTPRFDPSIGTATQFQPGNASQLTHGAAVGLEHARDRQREAAAVKAALVAALDEACAAHAAELQVRQGFPATIAQRGVIRRYAEADGIASTLFQQLMDAKGPITATGKIKRVFVHYLAAHDRQVRAADKLGLPKPPRDLLPVVPSVSRDAYEPED